MIAKAAHQLPDRTSQPNRRAIAHLLEEYERAKTERDGAEARLIRFEEMIRLFISSLPAFERSEFEQRFAEMQGGVSVDGRAGAVHHNVVSLFAKNRRTELSVQEVHSALEKEGLEVDSKSVYNSIAYLARTGKLMRVARGRYVLRSSGCEIEGEDYNYGNIRTTEHDV